jgi:hypothetical protein
MESLTQTVTFRLTPDELSWLRSAANDQQCSRSALVREILLEYRETRARGGACVQVISRRIGRRKNDKHDNSLGESGQSSRAKSH